MAIRQGHPQGVIHLLRPGKPIHLARLLQTLPGSRGAPFDGFSRGRLGRDALRESFFATLECEFLDRHRFRSQEEARRAEFGFIEGW